MVFGDNVLKIENSQGFGIEFNAFDSMKQVDAHNDPIKVAAAQKWQEARYSVDIKMWLLCLVWRGG